MGIHPSEIGQLHIAGLATSKDATLIDLQRFDPKKDLSPRKDTKQLKTANTVRKIPLYPPLVELGLLESARDLKSI